MTRSSIKTVSVWGVDATRIKNTDDTRTTFASTQRHENMRTLRKLHCEAQHRIWKPRSGRTEVTSWGGKACEEDYDVEDHFDRGSTSHAWTKTRRWEKIVRNKDRVWDAVEDDPVNAKVVVEEGNCDRKNYEICDEQQQHHEIPVEPADDSRAVVC